MKDEVSLVSIEVKILYDGLLIFMSKVGDNEIEYEVQSHHKTSGWSAIKGTAKDILMRGIKSSKAHKEAIEIFNKQAL